MVYKTPIERKQNGKDFSDKQMKPFNLAEVSPSIYLFMVLSISTSYLVSADAGGADIVRGLTALDISKVEPSYSDWIDEEFFSDIR